MKNIVTAVVFIFGALNIARAEEGKIIAPQVAATEVRIVNNDTRASYKFSTTPTFKSIYELWLINIDISCDEKDVTKIHKTKLPKSSYFRKTFDRSAQTENEMIVHVYELSSTKENEQEDKSKYFSGPFKLCTAGNNYTPKSLYKRVGGLNTGVLFVPFKMRGGDLFSDSTVGPYISYKFETLEYIFTTGLSQIATSEVGTTEIENKTGLTVALGVSFEVDKSWDIAILTGSDHLSGKDGDDWKYQDKLWLSFAVGFNFTR